MRMAPMNGRFLDACRRRATDVRPVWFMRQAGRYLKQYREIRAHHGILEICKRPDLAAEVTLQPVDILDVDAAIIFAPAGELVPAALSRLARGGTVVCAGIHMSDIPSFPYDLLWGERKIRSVANLTRRDGDEFFELAARLPLRVHTTTYPLARANEALADLRAGRVTGAAVLEMR